MLALLVAAAVTTLSPALQRSIRNHFDTVLLDGPSARWKWPAAKNGKLYCGWVNAKNTMGAYTGWTPFYVIVEGSQVAAGGLIDNQRTVAQLMREKCQESGYDVETPPRS